jgi:hypothetical protein
VIQGTIRKKDAVSTIEMGTKVWSPGPPMNDDMYAKRSTATQMKACSEVSDNKEVFSFELCGNEEELQ